MSARNRQSIRESRHLCIQREYDSALNVLRNQLRPDRDCSEIYFEMVRVHMISGDRPAVLRIFREHPLSGSYAEAQALIEARIAVWSEGALSEALEIATRIWKRYKTFLGSSRCDDLIYLILYYCTVINSSEALYGEGDQDHLHIKSDGTAEKIGAGLFKSDLYFEAFYIYDDYLQSTSAVFEDLMTSQQNMANRAACALRLAEILALENNKSAAAGTLDGIHKVIAKEPFNQNIEKYVQLRYINHKAKSLDVVKELGDIADWFFRRNHFNDALWTYSEAVDLHNSVPAGSKSLELALRLCDQIQDLWLRVEDTLSLTKSEFQRCDMIATLGEDYTRACKERGKLLKQPICSRLPYFQVQHKRQWSECSAIFQREQALYHARKYAKFCQQYRKGADQSDAAYCIFHSLATTQHMPERDQIKELQNVQHQIEAYMTTDRREGFEVLLLNKLLLLHKVHLDLADLTGEYDHKLQLASTRILDEAEDVATRAMLKGDDTKLRNQIALERYTIRKGQSYPTDNMMDIDDLGLNNKSDSDQQTVRPLDQQQIPQQPLQTQQHVEKAASEQTEPQSKDKPVGMTVRVTNIPSRFSKINICQAFDLPAADPTVINIRSLAPDITYPEQDSLQVATLTSPGISEALGRRPLSYIQRIDYGAVEGRSGHVFLDRAFLGMTVLYDPEVEQAGSCVMDLVAVHGLNGHPFGSWRASEEFMWLRDGLPSYLTKARIMIYGYNTTLHRSTSFADMVDHGKTLLQTLNLARPEAIRKRPLVMLGQSMGGLLIKQAIVHDSQIASSLRTMSGTLRGLILLGTPHRGLKVEHLLAMVESQPNEEFIHSLAEDSSALQRLHQDFVHAVREKPFSICSWYETHLSPSARKEGDGFKMTGPLVRLVSKSSATNAVPWEQTSDQYPSHQTHSGMGKLEEGSNDYRLIISQLRACQSSIERESRFP